MNTNEFNAFASFWMLAHEQSASNAIPSNEAVCFVFDSLSEFEIKDVFMAIRKHTEKSRFAPTVADIFEILNFKQEKWLAAAEAWTIAVRYFNPYQSVVITPQILSAAIQSEDLYNQGQGTAARAAFSEIYNRLVAQAQRSGITQNWVMNHLEYPKRDYSREQAANDAIENALQIGIINRTEAKQLGYTRILSPDDAITRLSAKTNAQNVVKLLLMVDGASV